MSRTWSLPVKEEVMSEYQAENDQRACRRCGATLSMWDCDACGSSSFDTITDAYVAELASPWRYQDGARDERSFAVPIAA